MLLSVAFGLSRALGVLRISACPSNWTYDPCATLSTDVTQQNSAEANPKASAKASKAKVVKGKKKQKRPATAYNLFMKETLAGRYHTPGLTNADILRESGRTYRRLPDAEKQKYTVAAAEAKQEHLTKLRAEAAPKRPVTAYNLYIRDEMPNRPKDQLVRDWMRVLAAEFKKLPVNRLEAFKSLAKKDFDRHVKEKEMLPKKPKAKGPTAYNVFTREKLSGATTKDVTGNLKRVAEEWKSLSDDDKKRYIDLAEKENEIFKASKPATIKKTIRKIVVPASRSRS